MANDGSAPNWDHFLQNSSALGILRPDAVFDVFGSNGSSSADQGVADAGVRVVRAARVDGRSMFVADDLLAWYLSAAGVAQVVADQQAVGGRSGRSGQGSSSSSSPATVVFLLSDVPPGTAVPLRRSHALNFVVVLSEEIVLRLESGSGGGGDDQAHTTIRAGELAVVHPGTRYVWENHGTRACRMAWMMVAGSGQRIELPDGTVLG